MPGRQSPTDAAELKRLTGGTNVPGGIGSGTGETRNWIIAAAVADGQPGTVVDYVPVHASPCGMGFAYWEPTTWTRPPEQPSRKAW
jgi:hypothetical protein